MTVTALNRRAVSNPQPVVEIDGQRIDRVNELLSAVDMREQEGGLSALEMRLSNVATPDDTG